MHEKIVKYMVQLICRSRFAEPNPAKIIGTCWPKRKKLGVNRNVREFLKRQF